MDVDGARGVLSGVGAWWFGIVFVGLPEHFLLARGQNTEKEFIEMV